VLLWQRCTSLKKEENNIDMDAGKQSSFSVIGRLKKYIELISVRFHTAGKVKSAEYDCLVPFDYKSKEISLRV